MSDPAPELSANQKFLLGMKDIALCFVGNISFFDVARRKNPPLEKALTTNIDSLNTVISMMLAYKRGTLPEEYEAIKLLDPIFQQFSDLYLDKQVQIKLPPPKSKIILLGDN